MKLQNLTVIFIIIIIPVILLVSLYISTGLKTIKYQSLYDTGLLTATHDAIYAFELNTTNDAYSDNAETKRNILKSSVKMFEKSLANTCGISAYNTEAIEEYIPAIVFGMHDGFYMYAPSYNSQTGKYEHDLKNYVYYSETLDDGTVITYSLDNYVTVSGKFNGKYSIKEGYLIDLNGTTKEGTQYKDINIDEKDIAAVKYYKEAYYFTNWFLKEASIQNKKKNENTCDYLNISSSNNPEDENSEFVKHKRDVMRTKIESALNSSITAYSQRTWGRTYKMPKLSEEDWQKIYSNISMITFFQGKNIGLTKYNGYCVLNSTNSNEYVNPNLMYFIDEDGIYHDIRCTKKKDGELKGYKIGDFQKIKLSPILNEDGTIKTNDNGERLYDNGGTETTSPYTINHKETACYHCINGQLDAKISVYEYIKNASDDIKTAYWTSIARERYNTAKLLDSQCVVTYNLDGLKVDDDYSNIIVVPYGESFNTAINTKNVLGATRPEEIIIMMDGEKLTGGYTYNQYNGKISISEVTGDIIIIATVNKDNSNISFDNAAKVKMGDKIEANIDQEQRLRIFSFTPTESGKYRFYSADKDAKDYDTDPFAYLYKASDNSIDELNKMAEKYAIMSSTSTRNIPLFYTDPIKLLASDDDGGEGFNFKIEYNLQAGETYYLVIRTYNTSNKQFFSPIYIEKVN